ncbi:MAG: hydrolase, partial [Cystobacter sp.]
YAHAMRSSARVVERMYEAGGGVSVHRSSPLQRCLRDIHVGMQHAMVGSVMLETIGGVLLGMEQRAPLL